MYKIDLSPTDSIKQASRSDLANQKEEMIFSFVSPILFALLIGLKDEVIQSYNGSDKILLRELARSYREGDGDCGICFEYSIHSAIRNNSPLIIKRINEALNTCGIYGNNTTSILLGFEKSRVLQINDELYSNLTDRSLLFTDADGHSIKILDYIELINNSFRNRTVRRNLPYGINGLWKADLFVGYKDTDVWAAASVKINRLALQYAKGIAIGIVPSEWKRYNSIRTRQNMVICPLLYDNGFMQFFYSAWKTITSFLAADAHIPRERFLSCIEELQISEYLESKRETPVMELVDEIFSKLTRNTIILPEKKSIITTDIVDNDYNKNSNRSIIVPNFGFVNST